MRSLLSSFSKCCNNLLVQWFSLNTGKVSPYLLQTNLHLCRCLIFNCVYRFVRSLADSFARYKRLFTFDSRRIKLSAGKVFLFISSSKH